MISLAKWELISVQLQILPSHNWAGMSMPTL